MLKTCFLDSISILTSIYKMITLENMWSRTSYFDEIAFNNDENSKR